MNKICLTIFILFSSVVVTAQGQNLNLTGDAKVVNDLFYRLELVKGANQTGGAWYPQSFNLDSSFYMDIVVNFGELQAEGFAIVLHSDSIPVGLGAEQLGVPNTGNSFVVEFDLQQNMSMNDAVAPHTSVFKDGELGHQGIGLIQNLPLVSTLANSEVLRINWSPQTQEFMIQRQGCSNSDLYYKGDIKNNVFAGDSKVFVGFTAATSAVSDSILLTLSYSSAGISENQTICQGEGVKLSAYNSSQVSWSSSEPFTLIPFIHEDVTEGVGYEIFAKPINSGYYKVSNSNFCGTNVDSIWIEVLDTLAISTEVINDESKNTADILLTVEEGGNPYSIQWLLPDLSTSADQDLVDVPFGLYQVTVTHDNQCSSNLEILIPEPIVAPEPGVSEQDYFSPNGDGEDDYIRINVKGKSQIIDFQGRNLRNVNYGDLWDGTSEDGKLLPSGLYIIIGEEGKQVITLFR